MAITLHWPFLTKTGKRVTSLTFQPDMTHYTWRPVALVESDIPKAYRYWIHLPGSLTQALRHRCEDFAVQVLAERSLTLYPPPALLGPKSGAEACWSRTVCLCAGETPWVAAHTLLLRSSLQQGLDALTRLNDRPLGELLFTTAGVNKDSLEVTRTAFGWGRRSRYWLAGQPLLVAEFFLDELLDDEHKRLTALSQTNPA